MKPNLFLIGFQKCSSSSLFDFMIQHPEITGTNKKETFALTDSTYEHFDSVNSVLNDSFSWSNYFSQSDNKYYLEGSVCNFYQQTAKDYIKKTAKSKVIFVVRDPIERFVSTFNYYGGSGIHLQPGTTIEEYFELVQNKTSQKEAMNFALEHGLYVQFIEEWVQLLGQENVLVLGMKEVIKSPGNIAQKLGEFLKIDACLFPMQMSFKNKSEVVKNKKLHLLLRKVFGGLGLQKSPLRKIYRKLNRTAPEKTGLSDALTQKLKVFYKREYSELNELF